MEVITLNQFTGLNTFLDPTDLLPGTARDMQDVFRSSTEGEEGVIDAIQERPGWAPAVLTVATHTSTKGARISDLFEYIKNSAALVADTDNYTHRRNTIIGATFDQGRYDADYTDWTRRLFLAQISTTTSTPRSCACTTAAWNTMAAGGASCGGSYVKTYQLASYSDGDIGACGTCDASAKPAWTGTMDATTDNVCKWYAGGLATTMAGTYSINGKELWYASIQLDTSVTLGRWQLAVACDQGGTPTSMWVGYKQTGATPVGTYTRNSGCAATPSTLEVEAA